MAKEHDMQDPGLRLKVAFSIFALVQGAVILAAIYYTHYHAGPG